MRWTVTATRGSRGAPGACGTSSAPPGAGSTSTSLIYMEPLAMLAPGMWPSAGLWLPAHRVRWTAPVDDPLRARDPLRHALDLGRPRRERRSASERARLGHDDAGRKRNEARVVLVSGAVLRLDPAALPVGGVVERRHHVVEAARDLGGDLLGASGLGEDHEVVAADVAREVRRRVVLLEDLEDDGREGFDHVVAADEPVV